MRAVPWFAGLPLCEVRGGAHTRAISLVKEVHNLNETFRNNERLEKGIQNPQKVDQMFLCTQAV